jgi:hypothetical protein
MQKRREANRSDEDQSAQDRREEESGARPSKQARLRALLFEGASLGTTLLTVAVSLGFGKFPKEGGE